MTLLSKTITKTLTLSIYALLLSSCAYDNIVNVIPDFSHEEQSSISNNDPNDLTLGNIEPKETLNEELDALSRTGNWDEKPLVDQQKLFDETLFDFPVILNKKVNMYLELFQNKQKEHFGRWLSKSTLYRSMMEKELAEAGLPKDLSYLAMIESGFNPLACSSAKAVGLWQFMNGTGRQYDLLIDSYVDERRDPLKSTRAAVSYLSDLYQEFGDWYLAVAAYNAGPGTIRNGLNKYQVDNFWDLASKEYLHLETKRYVPKLIAALMIAKEPEKYGFSGLQYQQPLRYDTLVVGPGLNLEALALITDSTMQEIQGLNRELLQGKTPLNRENYEVNIPHATLEIAKNNMSRLRSVVSTAYKTHLVRQGDTLSKISKKYNVNKTTILKVNDLHNNELASGRNLKIPYSTIKYTLLPQGSSKALADYQNNLILHRIRPGETLSKISKRYNVPPEIIVGWNGLKNVHSIKAGQQLALYIENKDTKVSPKEEPSVALLSADRTKSKFNRPDTAYELYRVQNGDSLWTISRKFSASTTDIKKWNNLKTNLIQPGAQLKLKKV